MWSRLWALATILSVVSLGGAFIEEIRMPDTFSICLDRYTLKSNGSSTTAESIDYYCIQKHRMQLIKPFFTAQNISDDTNAWISELLRMSEVERYEHEHTERFKRQAGSTDRFPFPTTATQAPIIVNNPSINPGNQQSNVNQGTQNLPKMSFPTAPTQIKYQAPSQQTRQAQPAVQPQRRVLRIRKEYRRLTDQERNNFHRAILMLKADTVSVQIHVIRIVYKDL